MKNLRNRLYNHDREQKEYKELIQHKIQGQFTSNEGGLQENNSFENL